MKKISITLLALIVSANIVFAQTMREKAEQKMAELEKVIRKAKSKNINTLKEESALRMAEFFMIYADWDENNKDKTAANFKRVYAFKKEPQKWANILPEFEREEVYKMMKSSIKDLNDVLSKKVIRLETPQINWAETVIEKDQITYKGKPVFLTDWTWKPSGKEYDEFHGQQDGFFITGSQVINEKGDISPNTIKDLKSKEDGTMGFIFINHKAMPKWAIQKDPKITQGKGAPFIDYDINNPLMRKIYSNLIKGTVPEMAGKQYTKLGYMLSNEPRWILTEKAWYADSLSDIAYNDFKKWLEVKHKTIDKLNKIWGTSFTSFKAINTPKIMTNALRGTNMYFDYMRYNMYRANDWFEFLGNEIKKYDSQAKVHNKVMPHQWSDSERDHGIDLERIVELSDIIGNDARSCRIRVNKPNPHWAKNYSFNWDEICMAYDFMKSISPEKIVYNTEAHMLSIGAYRNLYETREYTRINYWTAHIHGLTATQTWYWCRKKDGSARKETGNGYAGSNNHQPRAMNEVHATTYDLNSVSDKIMAFQRQRKPIRIFFTEASAIGIEDYMNNIWKSYEAVAFDGYSIGFATQNIIKKQDKKLWDVIVVAATPKLFIDDLKALQSYLDNGGTIVVDSESIKTDEYGLKLPFELKQSRGKLIKTTSSKQAREMALAIASKGENKPSISLKDGNGLAQKGAMWKVIEGKKGSKIINIANLSKNKTTITLTWSNGKPIKSVTNVLTGEKLPSTFNMEIFDVKLLECK